MKRIAKGLIAFSAGTVLLSTAAFSQQMAAGRADLMSSVPSSSLTVTDWYKQPVYDKTNAKIGDINDVLVGPTGEVNAVILGVGGFLGAGEKDVAVNFSAIKKSTKDDKTYLTMDTTKDALKSAPGFKYDSDKTSWVPANK
jgi:sporulation protein YlmC with PRC-barrel domain